MTVSAITDALKKSKENWFLIRLDFEGWEYLFTNKGTGISIDNSNGSSKFFNGQIYYISNIVQSLSLYTLQYSLGNVIVRIVNKNRFQDNERRHRLEKGVGSIYIWAPGLDWTDIEDYPVFKGSFTKNYHDREFYEFSLIDQTLSKMKVVPVNYITTSTWSNHRTEGGGGSVSGLSEPLIFGYFEKGIPVYCVDTVGFKYLLCNGIPLSIDDDYTAATQNLYDKDGAVIDPANYTFYPSAVDEKGNIIAYFGFGVDQSSNEPMSCSVEGFYDDTGIYTGEGGTLLENPGSILHYLFDLFRIDQLDIDLDITTIKTFISLFNTIRIASYINQETSFNDIISRISMQFLSSKIQRWGKLGIVYFDLSEDTVGILDIDNSFNFDIIEIKNITKMTLTPVELINNNFNFYYRLNPTTSAWESSLIKNKNNDSYCKDSASQYGERNQYTVYLADVREDHIAEFCARIYIRFFSKRRDIIEFDVPYWKGFKMVETDIIKVTAEEAPSIDGNGWSDEACILIEKIYKEKSIGLKLMRISTD